jgi:D-arabinan exo alpha-(1,3)/(1,5)-arabinofuranosidase (non-reducing end)
MIDSFGDPARIDPRLESRSISFENLTGAPGRGGTAHRGRKGAPQRMIASGERITLADVAGPGRVRHVWLTVSPMPPEQLRRIVLEIYYDGLAEPSVSVPLPDFFGCAHGRPVPLVTAFTAVQEGRGFNATFPMPFRRRIRLELWNASGRAFPLYFQVDYTSNDEPPESGLLHVAFRRENPTELGRDMEITSGIAGPGRFLGCVIGVRVLSGVRMQRHFSWYGEGEVKFFLDGDREHPTICGTGFEDYAGTAWGMGAHQALWSGVPHNLRDPCSSAPCPDFASLYRWHGPDPIVFRRELRATVQQIGAVFVARGEEHRIAEIEAHNPVAGVGWLLDLPAPGYAFGICERVDDVCAAAFVYARDPQPVPRVDPLAASADLERRAWEQPSPFETIANLIGGAPPPGDPGNTR